jgi:plasmid stabilization system protein ParE
VDFEVRITKGALAEFEEILAYSWANFPQTAERFGNALLDHLDILKSFPYIGSPVVNRPSVRQLAHTPILIYYRVDETACLVEVLHFWHGSRQKPPAGETS